MTFLPIELKAYKIRLENDSSESINHTIHEILDFDEFPAELLPIVRKAMENGVYITGANICGIVIYTGSMDFYEFASSNLDDWELSRLLEGGFYREDIEELLCKKLYKVFRKNDDPLRSTIVSALRTQGKEKALDMLEIVKHELAPPNNQKKIEHRNILHEMELQSYKSFLKSVEEAIQVISSRLRANGSSN